MISSKPEPLEISRSHIINRRERCEEVKEYFDGIHVARELAGIRLYTLNCAYNTDKDFGVMEQLYDAFKITYHGMNNNMSFRSYLDRYELHVSLNIKLEDSNARNKFKGIFRQYGYDYKCKPYRTKLIYEIKFKDDFKIEELIFICKFFLQYMK